MTNDEKLILEAIEGNLDEAPFAALQTRLREEPELLSLYREHALLDHSLNESRHESAMVKATFPKPAPKSRMPGIFAAAAAAVIVLGGFWFLLFSGDDAATVAFSADAVWEGEIEIGSELKLSGGQARVTLPSGAVALLSAPARISLEAEDTFFLSEGSGRFEKQGGGLVVNTDSFTATDLGTVFGVREGELHVFDGAVEIETPTSSLTLIEKEAASVAVDGSLSRHAASKEGFLTALPKSYTVLRESFTTQKPSAWKSGKGEARILSGALEGSDFELFRKLDSSPNGDRPILLITMQTAEPSSGDFHSDQWAGLSLFSGDEELGFFGDSQGSTETWSLDVRQKRKPVRPTEAVRGARTVTLRYDWNTGDTSLHEGDAKLSPAFVSAKLPAHLNIDRIRLGASESSALAVKMIAVRLLEFQ